MADAAGNNIPGLEQGALNGQEGGEGEGSYTGKGKHEGQKGKGIVKGKGKGKPGKGFAKGEGKGKDGGVGAGDGRAGMEKGEGKGKAAGKEGTKGVAKGEAKGEAPGNGGNGDMAKGDGKGSEGNGGVAKGEGKGKAPGKEGKGGMAKGDGKGNEGNGGAAKGEGKGKAPGKEGKGDMVKGDGKGKEGNGGVTKGEGKGKAPGKEGKGDWAKGEGKGNVAKGEGKGKAPGKEGHGAMAKGEGKGKVPWKGNGKGEGKSKAAEGKGTGKVWEDGSTASPAETTPAQSPSVLEQSSPDEASALGPKRLTYEEGVAAGQPEAVAPRPNFQKSFTSVSMQSDGTGKVPMGAVGVESKDGKVRRVKVLDEETKQRIQAMTDPKELDALYPGEAKRQREALRRKVNAGGLRPGLVEKIAAAHTDAEKFELLKSFILDPTLDSITVESYFQQQAKESSKEQWLELPLDELEKKYSDPDDRAWLHREVVQKQSGRPHPQDPKNEKKRLYRIFQGYKHESGSSKTVGSSIVGHGKVEANKAKRQALADHITAQQASFNLQPALGPSPEAKPKPKPKAKPKAKATHDQQRKKDFDKDLKSIENLADKARAAMQAITNHRIANQQATAEALKAEYHKLKGRSTELHNMIFEGKSLDDLETRVLQMKTTLENSTKTITDAETIISSFERRLAAQKRKAEKGTSEPKKKAKAKAEPAPTPVKTEQLDTEEWPEWDTVENAGEAEWFE